MFSLFRRNGRRAKPSRRTPPSIRPRLEALEDRCLLSAGALDPTFGNGGLVQTVPGNGGRAEATAIQSNGDIVVAGWAKDPRSGEQDFMVARYNLNGTLDTTFGNGGIVLTPVGRLNSSAWGVAIQPDGKIVAVGTSAYYGAKQQQYSEAAIVRYNVNGTLDTTFGSRKTPGIAVSTTAPGYFMALEANGDIVTAGDQSVARFTSNGSLDTTFGQTGVVSLNVYRVNSVTVQPADGKIVAAGGVRDANGSQLECLARLNTNGSLDSTFGTGGYVSKQYSPGTPLRGPTWTASFATSVLIQPDGKLVTAGFVQEFYADGSLENGMVLARFNSDGSPDGGFGSGGSVISTAIDGGVGGVDAATVVARQADGSLVVAGDKPNNQGDFVTSRYSALGQLDTTWGTNGVSDVSAVNGVTLSGHPNGIALEPNGTIVVAGSGNVNVNGTPCIFVARYLPSEPEIGSFTANPNPVASGTSTTLTASNISDGNPNSTITQVTFYYYDVNGNKVVLGTGTEDSSGDWTLTYAVNLASGTYPLYAQAEDNYGVLGDPDALTLTVQ